MSLCKQCALGLPEFYNILGCVEPVVLSGKGGGGVGLRLPLNFSSQCHFQYNTTHNYFRGSTNSQ